MIFGTHQDNTLEQFRDIASRADHAALMADGHLGYIMPVGGVAAYKGKVSVSGVGYDIACGNCAIRTDIHRLDEHMDDVVSIADAIAAEISFGIGRKNKSDDAPDNHSLFDDERWLLIDPFHRGDLRHKARGQLGTVGGGNHYVDVFYDEEGYIWVGVHFGSRGFGHTIASNYLALAKGEPWGTRVSEFEALIDVGPDCYLGESYLALMSLAGEYAYTGREWVARKVVKLLGGQEVWMVHNHHNFAWREQHNYEDYWVVRKGATPAFPGQYGFVGGSMGDKSVILRGAEDADPETLEKQRAALYSTVHGAGRVMSRTEAKGKWRKGQQRREGKVRHDEWREAIKGVEVRGGDLDEAPQVYRKLDDVLAAQGDTIEVVHTLTPIIVVMAGPEVRDPYKD